MSVTVQLASWLGSPLHGSIRRFWHHVRRSDDWYGQRKEPGRLLSAVTDDLAQAVCDGHPLLHSDVKSVPKKLRKFPAFMHPAIFRREVQLCEGLQVVPIDHEEHWDSSLDMLAAAAPALKQVQGVGLTLRDVQWLRHMRDFMRCATSPPIARLVLAWRHRRSSHCDAPSLPQSREVYDGNADAQRLANMLKCASAQVLHLTITDFPAYWAALLAPALKAMTALRHLHISQRPDGIPNMWGLPRDHRLRSCLASFAPTLRHMSALQRLHVQSAFDHADTVSLSKGLPALHALQQLIVEAFYSQFTAELLSVICGGLLMLTQLQHLEVRNCKCPVVAQQLPIAMRNMRSLQHLSLRSNHLVDLQLCDVHAFVRTLPACSRLKVLDVLDHGFDSDAFAALADSIGQLSTVQVLRVGPFYQYGEPCASSDRFAHSVCKLTDMRELKLDGGMLGKPGLKVLGRGVSALTRLTCLIIRHTSASSDVMSELAASLACLQAVQALDLGGCGLQDRGACALAEALPDLIKLEELVLEVNGIQSKGTMALVKGLRCLKSLACVDFSMNPVGVEGAAWLALLVAQDSPQVDVQYQHRYDVDKIAPDCMQLAPSLPWSSGRLWTWVQNCGL